MTFLCVFLCPFFEAKPEQILHQNRIQNPTKVYAHDALTNAYIQCVENRMPVRKAAKLYNIPHTTLSNRLSDRAHILCFYTLKQFFFSNFVFY